MAERSKALIYMSQTAGVGSNPTGDVYSSLPLRIEQLSGAHANEIEHDIPPVVIVVLDPRCDLSYKVWYTYGFKCFVSG